MIRTKMVQHNVRRTPATLSNCGKLQTLNAGDSISFTKPQSNVALLGSIIKENERLYIERNGERYKSFRQFMVAVCADQPYFSHFTIHKPTRSMGWSDFVVYHISQGGYDKPIDIQTFVIYNCSYKLKTSIPCHIYNKLESYCEH